MLRHSLYICYKVPFSNFKLLRDANIDAGAVETIYELWSLNLTCRNDLSISRVTRCSVR